MQVSGRSTSDKITFMRCIRNGDTIIEVGANRGEFTSLFSHWTGRTGAVIAFEPVPPTFERLQQRVAREKRFDNIVLVNTAVGDSSEPITVYMPDEDDGHASLQKHTTGSWQDAQRVVAFEAPMQRLDDYLAGAKLERFDFLKVDVEGAELLVLRGATEALRKYRPLIHLEVCSAWTDGFDYKPAEIVSFLRGLGYSAFYLIDHFDRSTTVLKDAEAELGAMEKVSADLICAAPGRHDARLRRLREDAG